MKDMVVIFNYPESYWGTDMVCFHLDKDVDNNELMDTIDDANAEINSEKYGHQCFVTEVICNIVANRLGGTWDYVVVAGSYDIKEER